ncbi:hypothetical protein [Mycoplasma phocoenae]|uniref:Uncharacterized protein n=1 Tax=Mycoplasma phocoenae TaxID=754517 RepID=A0A858U430_9MOLU|nr:hypothetical protein [Mycoplasma phocoenae]QJG67192.1 hypothetical protein HGG69_02665 [Mycoplasma phocoenae]
MQENKTLIWILLILILVFIFLFFSIIFIFNYFRNWALKNIEQQIKNLNLFETEAKKINIRFETLADANKDLKEKSNHCSNLYTNFSNKLDSIRRKAGLLKNKTFFCFKQVKTLDKIKRFPELLKIIKELKTSIKRNKKEYKKILCFSNTNLKFSDLLSTRHTELVGVFQSIREKYRTNIEKYNWCQLELKQNIDIYKKINTHFSTGEYLNNIIEASDKIKQLETVLNNILYLIGEATNIYYFVNNKMEHIYKRQSILNNNKDIYENFIKVKNINEMFSEFKQIHKELRYQTNSNNFIENQNLIKDNINILVEKAVLMVHLISTEENKFKMFSNFEKHKNEILSLIKMLNNKFYELNKDYSFYQKNNYLTGIPDQQFKEIKTLMSHDYIKLFENILNDSQMCYTDKDFAVKKLVKRVKLILHKIISLKGEFNPYNDLVDKMNYSEFALYKLLNEIEYWKINTNFIERKHIKELLIFKSTIIHKHESNSYEFNNFKEDVEKFSIIVETLKNSIGLKIEAKKIHEIFLIYMNPFRHNDEKIDHLLKTTQGMIQENKELLAIRLINDFIEKGVN